MPFLHNQILSAGQAGGTSGGVFTFVDADFPVFKTTTNDGSSHSLEFTLHNQGGGLNTDWAYWTAQPQGAAFWASGFTIEVWIYLYANTNHSEFDNIIRMGTAVNNYGQAIGIGGNPGISYLPPGQYLTVWNTQDGGTDRRYVDNTLLSPNQWYHFCIERGPDIGDYQRFSYYLNGAQRLSVLDPDTTYSNSLGQARWHDSQITLGKGAPGPSTNNQGFQGLINSARISTGVRYGSSFTPSTTLTKDSSTWFLVQLNNNYATV